MEKSIYDLKEAAPLLTPEIATASVLVGLARAREALSIPRNIGPEFDPCYGIKISGIADVEGLAELYRISFPGYPFSSLVQTTEGQRKMLEDPSMVRIIIHVEDIPVAAAALGTIPPDLSAEIKQVVVHPDYRGRGLTLPMLLGLIAAANLSHLEYVYMDVRTRMKPMQRAALKAGFIAVGLRIGQHLVYHLEGAVREHMVHMVRLLNGASKRLDPLGKQNIDPEVVSQLNMAGVDYSKLLTNQIWK